MDVVHEIYKVVFLKLPEHLEKDEGLFGMSTDTREESLRICLAQQLEDVEQDIAMISGHISDNPPETSGELLKLRELQRKYREIATSLKNEIVKLG
jgi:hypothetical protein